jgi:hypothetical protein
VKIKRFVRQSMFLGMMLIGVTQVHAETLSTIEAHEFESTPVQKSKTGRVYLFKTEAGDLPKTGNLILIQVNGKPAMAFRVLRNDPVNQEYIATRVRRYDQTGELKINEHYHSVEKVADLLAPPPQVQKVYDANAKPEMGTQWADQKAPQTATTPDSAPAPVPMMGSDSAGNAEAPVATESAIPADQNTPPMANAAATPSTPAKHLDVNVYDDELDSTTSPRDLKKESEDEDEDAATDSTGLPKTQYEVDEAQRFEKYKHMATFGVGYFKNMSKFSFNNASNGGLSGAYSWITDRDVYAHARNLQDDMRFEVGFEYYSLDNANNANDNYNLLPVYGQYVYNLHVSDTTTFDAYAGLQYNLIMSSQNAQSSTYSNLSGIQINLGVGILYNLGPQWYLRADIGLDRVGAGLCIKW